MKPTLDTSLQVAPPRGRIGAAYRRADGPDVFAERVLGRLVDARVETGLLQTTPLVAELATLVLRDTADAARAQVRHLRIAGLSVERLHQDILPAVSRRLGDLWCEDLLSFSDVTHGAMAVSAIVRDLAPDFTRPGLDTTLPVRRSLLCLAPAETHSLGALMAANELRRGGWQVDLMLSADVPAIVGRAVTGSYDMVGLSAGSLGRVAALTETVAALRAADAKLPVVLGGAIVGLDPDIGRRVGAFHAAPDARHFVQSCRIGLGQA